MAKGLVEAATNGGSSIGKSKSDAYVFEEIIPGLSIKTAPRSKKASKEPIPPPAPSTPSPAEVNYSTYKSVNSVTQFLYTRYRNAKKRLARIEALESKVENAENLTDFESQLLSRKSDDLATVNEIHKILPQIAELSQEANDRAEESKAQIEKAHKEEIEKVVQEERERAQKKLNKAIDLFSSILLTSQEHSIEVEPKAKRALDALKLSFATKPLDDTKKTELLEHIDLFSVASEKPITKDSLNYRDLNATVEDILTQESNPTSEASKQNEAVSLPGLQAVPFFPIQLERTILPHIDLTEDSISESDFDSPAIELSHLSFVPPGGISFLSPSEIFPSGPRGQNKTPILGLKENL
ncbi:hypothetical protein DSO57_1025034 [Entomophthora muscae]|uniref:Uncharacterized protein n=1 Tax=Entomophthora muscae TaxID=34485 RepID=A0ACC2UP24_9FUNG|nr:hypothetical protein DSO57_1025034 [Entomophthora muscae]